MAAKGQKIRIKVKSFDKNIIQEAVTLIVDTAARTGAIVIGPIPLPTKRKMVTVNRSTFVNKDARDQFEMRTHIRLLDITEVNPKTVDALTNLSLQSGVDVTIKMLAA
ncbi:30S ribosomal protein S10 [Candidatus Gracilibacteria bacterium CG17_big_fil_post_rev_8_21_14_2_50_48_13]|nr:MAG: 30S ribosomal protein S10 [Candidatus Gracilibacteria bacterium CG17_big_fil_post_rev_8_21_14_2_50_48_13]